MRTIAIIGTDWEGPNTAYRRQPFHSLDRRKVEDWANVFYELGDLARVDSLAVGIRGCFDAGVSSLPVARAAYLQAQAPPHPTLMPWYDTVGLPDIVNDPGRGEVPFDFANDQHLAWGWERYARIFFDHFDDLPLERSPQGRVLLAWWGIASDTGHGFTNQHLAQRLLDDVDRRVAAIGLGGADHIVDKTWLELCPSLRVYAVHDWFNPWTTPPAAYSIRRHHGVTVGVTVPSFYGIINPDGNADTIRHALAAMRAAHADYVLIESGTNFIEGAELMRDSTGTTSKLDAVREHIDILNPSSSVETSMLQLHDALRRTHAIPHPDRPGYFTSPYPGSETGEVLSVQPDRTIAPRPAGTAGPWETWRDDGTKAVFEDVLPGGAIAILLVD